MKLHLCDFIAFRSFGFIILLFLLLWTILHEVEHILGMRYFTKRVLWLFSLSHHCLLHHHLLLILSIHLWVISNSTFVSIASYFIRADLS